MRILGCALTVCVVLVLIGCKGGNKTGASSSGSTSSTGATSGAKLTNADKIVGTWEMVKDEGKDAPKDTTATFTKDGKVTISMPNPFPKATPKIVNAEGTYTIEGEKLTMKVKFGPKESPPQVLTIQTLNDTTLIMKDEDGKVSEAKRK